MNTAIRELKTEDLEKAQDLIWRVFQVFEAPEYSDEGTQEFYRSIHDEQWLSTLRMYGAYDEDALIGVIATRNEGSHIALFFVDEQYQGKGIGRQLFNHVHSLCPARRMTVNASPYAVKIYHRLGFRETDEEQNVHGLRFIPMERCEQDAS